MAATKRRIVACRTAGLAAAPTAALGLTLVVVAAAVGGLVVGLLVSRVAQRFMSQNFNPMTASIENSKLRGKVEELQQLVMKLEPMAYRRMQLRFTKGVNKSVVLGMVDQMLANKEVNIWWLPDDIERIFYVNVITLMLRILDEMVDGMSINFAGHNVKMQLTYLDPNEEANEGVQQNSGTGAGPPTGGLQLKGA